MDIPRLKDLVPAQYAQDQHGLVLLGGYWDIDRDITISEPIWFMGGILRPLDGVTIKINGPIYAPVTQIFDLSKGGTIVGNPELEAVNPVWWGADPDHVEDSAPAINAAINFCNGTFKPAVEFVAGNYLCMKHIEKNQSFYMPTVRGAGGGNMSEPGGTMLDFTQAPIGLDTNGEPGACVYIKGGSGTLALGGLDRLTIRCNSNQAGIVVADQGGILISNCQVQGAMDCVQFYNQAPNGFTEWNKLVNCTFMLPARNCVRFKANSQATDSFHGTEVIDCWLQISNGAPSAIHVGERCYWYNGTCRARVFFHGNPGKYQDVITVDPKTRDVEIEGYFKTEGGYGWGRLGSGRTIWFAGQVVCLGSVTWGSVVPVEYYFRAGPEAGAGNGASYMMIRGMSHSRSITVDANGNAPVGLYCHGAMDCEITVRAGNYEYNISGIARPQYSGMNGAWNKTAVWTMTNATGWGEPSFWVGSNNELYIQNRNYPPGAVKLHIWYRQRSMSAAMGKYMTQNPG